MGWKNVKQHYRIKNTVRVKNKGILIGSPAYPDLMVIDLQGNLVERYNGSDQDLVRYQTEMLADPAKLRELVALPDSFEKSIPVYTYDGAEIIEQYCEEPGWSNVTHDGELMYENTHFANREQAVGEAKRNAAAGVELVHSRIQGYEEDLFEARAELEKVSGDLAKLNAAYPDIPADEK
jgi:hypothetical protein